MSSGELEPIGVAHDFVVRDAVVADVLALLGDEQAENVDRQAITVEGEGPEVEIVVIPHRDLGGLSLVVVNDHFGTYLRWTAISAYLHDDIDVATQVVRLTHLGEWRVALREQLRGELSRPITVCSKSGWLGQRLECSIHTDRERRVAFLRTKEIRLARPIVTSLARGPDLGFSMPVPFLTFVVRCT
jgi:hypothetical protein